MRERRLFLLLSGILAACGGDDGSTATTMPTTTSVTGNMTGSTNPSGDSATGTGESSDSSETTPTSDVSTSEPVPGAPVFLSLQTNVSKITAGESVIFTAVLTDPDGVDDIVGGTLSNESGGVGYGPFVAAGQKGTYSITLSWDDMNQAEAIQFDGMNSARQFRAEFYDQAANKVSKNVDITLTCMEGAACGGMCTDVLTSVDHCGTCEKSCEGGCDMGQCAPKFGECIDSDFGFATCDAYCLSVSETCVANGCGDNPATFLGFDQQKDCEVESGATPLHDACEAIQTWGIGASRFDAAAPTRSELIALILRPPCRP